MKMKIPTIQIYDGYNNKVHPPTNHIIGTVVPQNSRWGLTNGYKIIEVVEDIPDEREYKFFQYPRGDNGGGVLDVEVCPTISTSSWQNNCFLIEIDYGVYNNTKGRG